MVICQWVQNRMPAFLSGELGASQAAWVRGHIKGCAICQKALKALKVMQEAVSQALATDVSAPETLDARILSVIDDLGAPPAPPPRRSLFRRRE